MWKNIGKSFLWGYLYMWASGTGVVISLIIFFVENISSIFRDLDLFLEQADGELLKMVLVGTFIASIICIIVYVAYKCIFKHPVEINKLQFSSSVFCFSLGVTFNMVVTYMVDFIWSFLPEEIAQSALESSSGLNTEFFPWFFLLISVGIMIPIGEEIIFRHGICRVLARSNSMVAIIVSSLLFGIAHGNLVQGVYTCVMGVLCSLLIINTDNIWYPIFVHIGLNSTTVLLGLFEEDVGYMILTILGFCCMAICATMLIHKKEIRAMLAKPDRFSKLQETEPTTEIFTPQGIE